MGKKSTWLWTFGCILLLCSRFLLCRRSFWLSVDGCVLRGRGCGCEFRRAQRGLWRPILWRRTHSWCRRRVSGGRDRIRDLKPLSLFLRFLGLECLQHACRYTENRKNGWVVFPKVKNVFLGNSWFSLYFECAEWNVFSVGAKLQKHLHFSKRDPTLSVYSNIFVKIRVNITLTHLQLTYHVFRKHLIKKKERKK